MVLHIGTAVALLLYFWRDYWGIALGILAPRRPGAADSRHALWLIVVATFPPGVVGFLFEKLVRGLFASPLLAALFLIANGFLLLLGDRLRRGSGGARPGAEPRNALDWKGALAIGFWQCLAFIPGISRSGAAMVGGLVAGLQHAEAAHFSFLIATPDHRRRGGAGSARSCWLCLRCTKHQRAGRSPRGDRRFRCHRLSQHPRFLMLRPALRFRPDALVPFAICCWVADACCRATIVLAVVGR